MLPSESATGGGQIDDSDLFEAKDVKIETMRSRGAGGQVRLCAISQLGGAQCSRVASLQLLTLAASRSAARQPNRVGDSTDAFADGHQRFDARLAVSTRGKLRHLGQRGVCSFVRPCTRAQGPRAEVAPPPFLASLSAQNRTKAYRVLRARLLDRKLQAEQDERRSVRLNQVKGTDRSEKIRTYNFPQGRLTDHRIPLTLSALEEAIEGGEVLDIINRELEEREDRERLDDVVEALMAELG